MCRNVVLTDCLSSVSPTGGDARKARTTATGSRATGMSVGTTAPPPPPDPPPDPPPLDPPPDPPVLLATVFVFVLLPAPWWLPVVIVTAPGARGSTSTASHGRSNNDGSTSLSREAIDATDGVEGVPAGTAGMKRNSASCAGLIKGVGMTKYEE